MSLFDNYIANVIYILFPLLCYLFYIAFNNVFPKKSNILFLEIALFTSTYLCIKLGKTNILLFNIPLFISYIKERNLCSIVLSVIIVVLFKNINIYILVIEYMTYFLINYIYTYKKVKKKVIINTFIIYNSIFIIINNYSNIYNILLNIIIFTITIYIILIILKKSYSISSIHMSLKEIQNDSTIRKSIFKITHEIKNPIAVCKGYLDMLDTNNQTQVEKYVPIIKNEIKRTLTLMNDFLEFSKINLNKDIMDIGLLIEEVLHSLDDLLNEQKIMLLYNIKDEEIFVNGDYDRLKQVIVNIIKNSVEAIEDKKLGKIFISYGKENNNIIIKIKDNGIGIDKEDMDKIYEMFYTTKKNGTGLGVSLSKEIIDGHNGTINYESIKNVGTTVHITLPLAYI